MGKLTIVSGVSDVLLKDLETPIPGTLQLFQRIVGYPASLGSTSREQLAGMPDLVLITDLSPLDLHRAAKNHPGLFYVARHHFSTANLGISLHESAFFGKLLTLLQLDPSEILYIDSDSVSLRAASLYGIAGVQFLGARYLETTLHDSYGFEFLPEHP